MNDLFSLQKNKSKKGFTVVEVIVATLVFSIAAAGIFAMTSGLRKSAVMDSKEDINAALIGKRVLEDLRTKVDATNWNQAGGPLDPATNPHVANSIVVDGKTYTPTYTVTQEADGGRKVSINITW